VVVGAAGGSAAGHPAGGGPPVAVVARSLARWSALRSCGRARQAMWSRDSDAVASRA